MKLFLIVPILLLSYSLSGQTGVNTSVLHPDSVYRPLTIDLPEIQVMGYRTVGQLKSTAGSITVIPIDQLENSAVSITAALSTVPGLVMQEGTLGTIKLTLRGIGSRYPYGTKKIKLFFGDIPLYSAEGETTFDDINPEYLSRVEVLRGPASSIHGASLGGTVILYPLRAAYNQEDIRLISSAGSFGYFKNSVIYANGSAKNDLMVSLSGIQSAGYRENSQYSRYSFFINQNHVFSKQLTGNMIVSGSKIRSQIPSSIDSVTFANHPQKAAANWLKSKGYEHPDRIFAGYSLNYKTLRNWNYSASAFLTSRKTEENRPFNFLNESALSYGGRILSQYSEKLGSIDFQFVSGSNLYIEKIGSYLSENIGGKGIKGFLQQKGKESLYQSDFFAQLEAKIRRITITGGLNFNLSGFRYTDQFNTDTLNQSGNYRFSPILAPRLSFTWNPVSEFYIYSSVNKGFSIPSLSETLSQLGLINRDIKPEKAWSFEQGFRANLFRGATFIDFAVYYMRVTDLIVPKRVAEDVYVGMNAGSSLHRGMEIAVQQRIIGSGNKDANRHISLVASLNYSFSRFNFQDFTADNINYSGNKLPGMPDQLFTGSLDLKTSGGFYSRVELNTSGDIPLNDLNSQYSRSWFVANLKAGYEFKVVKRLMINAALNIYNLTNESYASMVVVNAPRSASVPPRYFYPGLPRWFSCSVNLSYQNFEK